jgi:hypothetical protein
MHCARLGYLVVALLLVSSSRAEANIWDWIEELNGPGPSRSRGNFMLNVKCRAPNYERTNSVRLKPFEIPRSPAADATCLFVDFRALHADEDARFFPVNITITEVGTSVWLHRAVELGAGAGVITFTSRNPDTDTGYTGARMTISFPRAVFRPLLALPYARFQENARWGFFQIFFKESIIVGGLDQGDFASKAGTEFSRRYQRVESMGFIVDVVSLFNRTR